jgi:hypothetical protein
MSLAEDRVRIEVNETDFVDINAAIEKWQHFPYSALTHHGKRCCTIAREWIFSMDYSQLNGGNKLTGPRWLRHKFKWGPSEWPLTWCEAVEREQLDCGAHASLAHEVFTARGIRSYPAQFIQQFSEDATRQWCEKWGCEGVPTQWVKEDLIYHEGCAVVVRDNEIKVWDPSAGWWVSPKQFGGYGGLLALRVFTPHAEQSLTHLTWGRHRITPNHWQKIERARGDFALAATAAAGK